MRELREDNFFENKNDDAHEHVERVLDIVSLFNILGVTHDAVMLRVFPITLTGAAKSRWTDFPQEPSIPRISLRRLLSKGIVRHPRPLSTLKTSVTFSRNETLYQAWERYNDLLYKCTTHDINNHQKVNIFYNGLGIMNRQLLDLQGPISGMTPAQVLTTIDRWVPALFAQLASSKRKKQAKRKKSPTICKTGVAKSYPGSFLQ
nr:hypothetical protein [Tanacetum cinerariifolium]